ncbi:MAG: hypothetical protein ACI4F2_02840 [Acutalibacteraceae bacterium]
MKKMISLFFVLLLIAAIPIQVSATGYNEVLPGDEIEYFKDGTYCVTIFEETASVLTSTTKTKTKTSTYYNSSDEKLWSVSLTGTFTYTGSSATCTKSSVSYKIYKDDWKITSANATKSGRKATGEFVAKHYTLGVPTSTVNKTLTISCSNSGVFT